MEHFNYFRIFIIFEGFLGFVLLNPTPILYLQSLENKIIVVGVEMVTKL